MGADTSELTALAQDFETASGRVGSEGRKALTAQADDTKDFQQAKVPKDTWDLHNHITARVDGDGRSTTMHAEIGPVGEERGHGYFVEYGTARMGAQPFIEPSAEDAARTWPGRVEEMMANVTADL